jgi:hypothetical protein
VEIINNFGSPFKSNGDGIDKGFEQMISDFFGSEMTPLPVPSHGNGPTPSKDPFKNFEVVINGHKVTDPEEIKKEESMFDDMFDGFDFNFNPLNVAKDIHSMNSNLEKKYNLESNKKKPEQKLDPLAGLNNIISGLFGSLEDAFKLPDSFQKDFQKKKQKEKELKNMHDSIMKKSYINGYQSNNSEAKELGGVHIISDLADDTQGQDLLEKIKDTFDSTEKVEKSINIGGALKGIQSGMEDLQHLKSLNQEENDGILKILENLQNKYQNVNDLAHSLREDFNKVKDLKHDLKKLSPGVDRKRKEEEVDEMEMKLKNNKGRLGYFTNY